MMRSSAKSQAILRLAIVCTASGLLAACAAPPRRHVVREVQTPRAVVPDTQIYAYPSRGQSREQEQRDRFECHNWAVSQTGFDPSAPSAISRSSEVRVSPDPAPNRDAVALGVTGAAIGAMVAQPGQGLAGAVIGGTLGAVAGAASDNARDEHYQRTERAAEARRARRDDALNDRDTRYRRAASACLEGRGYRVQ